MQLFLKYVLIGLIFFGGEQVVASENFVPQSYQWFRIIDTGGAVPYYFDLEHFAVYTSINCDEDTSCLAYLVGTTSESVQHGKILLNDMHCGFQDLVTIPLTIINGDITTDAPANYTLGDCSVNVTGDPTSEKGYKITISNINTK